MIALLNGFYHPVSRCILLSHFHHLDPHRLQWRVLLALQQASWVSLCRPYMAYGFFWVTCRRSRMHQKISQTWRTTYVQLIWPLPLSKASLTGSGSRLAEMWPTRQQPPLASIPEHVKCSELTCCAGPATLKMESRRGGTKQRWGFSSRVESDPCHSSSKTAKSLSTQWLA